VYCLREQGYGNVYISDLALPEGKDSPLPLVAAKRNFRMEKDRQQPRPAKRNKVRVVSARFTDIEYQAVEKRRKDAGVSLSRFVRSVLLTGKVVQRISKADADVLRKLAGEANNINQLAHKANAGGFAGVATELMLLKKKLVQIIKQLSDDWKNK
jgi:hypothetical protein